MMIDAKITALLLGGLGLIIGFILWAFRLIPWWGIPVSAIAVPAILLASLILIGLGAWISRGSH